MTALPAPNSHPSEEDLIDSFTTWAESRGLELYPHQEEALWEIVTDSHVIASTPTGSGKSLIAVAAHAVALARGQRSVYTAPRNALVSEKFFDLVEIFGAETVGMLTGDSAINPGAPIICCTAEVLGTRRCGRGGNPLPLGDHGRIPLLRRSPAGVGVAGAATADAELAVRSPLGDVG